MQPIYTRPPSCFGPLGPVGAHGFARDASGHYTKGGQRVRAVRVPYEGRYRTYELFEHYPEATAQSLSDQDTSFMVSGAIDRSGEVDRYAFTSRSAQYVTVVVVPVNSLSDFDVTLLDGQGREIAASRADGRQTLFGALLLNSGSFIDFIQVPAARDAALQVRVSARGTNPLYPGYRLFVVGSTAYLPLSDITGGHQLR